MRLKEQRLWDRMRNNAKTLSLGLPLTHGIRLERIENMLAAGHPDVECLIRSVYRPVELKAVDAPPKRAATPVFGKSDGLSVEQRNWHMGWQRHGGRSYILAGVGSTQFLLAGDLYDAFNGMCMDDIIALSYGSSWPDIFTQLGRK